MKKLTNEEFSEAPDIIKCIYALVVTEVPMGYNLFKRAMDEHPEYFPDEMESRRKWALVPQEVHDAYWEEISAMKKEVEKDLPETRGLNILLEDPEKYREWSVAFDVCRKREEPIARMIHKKHYGPYDIEFGNYW